MVESRRNSDSPDPRVAETVTHETAPLPRALPERIGRYHVKRVIATGGMGTVYEATQENPRRVVAVKVMRQGIASKSALRRFEYEAQILARLRHPGIAQIYEAGTHDDGHGAVPYFAMEYIPNAKTITRFADEKTLGTRQRMELYAKVCDAVHHGHQKGIIHRDLKPGNILVDSHGDVKVIDFGVARGTDSDLAVTMLQTDIGQLIGTLQYMSPEQCEGDPHDIDTRSDVYALGVVLYELLSGKLPYDVSRSKIFDGTRMIREQQPTKLSTIDTALRGDVETIVFKALEKGRDRRYQSAVEFAQDIRRYLSGEAITARPPSIVYQLRLFARRNKAVFASLAAVFIVLVAGIIVSTSLYIRAEHARAGQSRERERAELERDKAEKFAEFMEQTLEGVGPSVALGRDTKILKDVMDAATKRIEDGELRGVPEAEVRLRLTIGTVYDEITEYDAAKRVLAPSADLAQKALEMNERLYPGDHPDVARGLTDLAHCLFGIGQRAEALPNFERALAMRRRLFPGDHADVAQSLQDIGDCLASLDRRPEALALLEEALAMRKRLFPAGNSDVVDTLTTIGSCFDRLSRFSEALPKFEEAEAMTRKLYPGDHPDAALAMNNLAWVLNQMASYDEAARMYQEVLTMSRRLLGEDHPRVATSLRNLASVLERKGDYDEAERLYREALALRRKVLGDDHPNVRMSLRNLAGVLERKGDYEQAERLYREAIASFGERPGEEDAEVAASLFCLAGLLERKANYTEAESLARRSLRIGEAKFPPNHRYRWFASGVLGSVVAAQGRFAEGEALLLNAHENLKDRTDVSSREKRDVTECIIRLYESWDAAEPGKGYGEKAAEWRARLEAMQTPKTPNAETPKSGTEPRP